MKKTISLIVFLLIIGDITAHENKTFTVQGNYVYSPEVESYQAIFRLQFEPNNYNKLKNYVNIEELKNDYLTMVEEEGIDVTKFDESKLSYYSSGNYGIDGTQLQYNTTSKKEIDKLLSISLNRVVNLRHIYVKYEDFDFDKGLQSALADAKIKAEKLASITGLILGEIKTIELFDRNYQTSTMRIYNPSNKEEFQILVEYSIKK